MGTCTDIDEQKLAEDELRRASDSEDEFFAMLVHELRNPIAPIAGAAQLLKMPGIDEHRVRAAGEVIGRQVRHMTELVDVSRVTRGLIKLDMKRLDMKRLDIKRLDINTIVDGAVEQASPMIEARGHGFLVRLPAEATIVLGDKTRLVQAIANLLNNAAKYTPKHGKIELRLSAQDNRLDIVVIDNGNGIAPDLMPYVFDLFILGKRTPDRAHGGLGLGLGLGLTLVKRIAALHGGEVGVDSPVVGKGSTFTMSIPLVGNGH